MNSYQPFLIAPFSTGLETDMEPWLLPQDAFSSISNGHIHHGRIEKRAGYQLWAKFPHTTTNLAISAITQANPCVVTVTSTAGLIVGQEIQINFVSGMTELNGNRFLIGALGATTISLQDLEGNNLDSSAYVAYAGGGQVSTLPGNPIMGIYQLYNDTDGSTETIVYDTRRMARYNSATNSLEPVDTTDVFPTGGDSDFFWADQWQYPNTNNRLYATNNVDPIRYFEPVTSTTTSTALTINSGVVTVSTALLVFVFANRLVLLNTVENGTRRPQRCRYSQLNNATVWTENTPGLGGFVDAPTGEQIISARFLGSFIVVFFSQSIWTLRSINNARLPFVWEKVNNFRACDAKMATQEYDQFVAAAGRRGLTATDAIEARRIDDKIEDFVSTEVKSSVWQYAFMGRDYNQRRSWMLYPSATTDATASDSVLIRDDDTGAFSIYSLALSALGHGEVSLDYTLADFTVANGLDYSILDYIDGDWNETLQSYSYGSDTEVFLGGDHSGQVHVMNFTSQDGTEDIEFELVSAAWNPFKEKGQEARFGYIDFYVDTSFTCEFTVEFFKNNSYYPYATQKVVCSPNFEFVKPIIAATQANPCVITANQHGLANGQQIYIYCAQGMTQLIGGPYIVANATTNTFELSGYDTSAFPAYAGGGVITLDEFYKSKEWKRAYAGGVGYQHKIKITNTAGSLIIHAMMPYFKPTGKRLVNR